MLVKKRVLKVGRDECDEGGYDTRVEHSDNITAYTRWGGLQAAIPNRGPPPFYMVLSVPRSDGNGPEAPVFCLDQVNGIERYLSAQAGDAIAAIATSRSDQCPLTGTHVD